jgi:hypothetical protein
MNRFRSDGPRLNFRQDFRYYTVREYGVMGLCALAAGLVIALLLTALSGGSAAEGTSLRRASVQEPLPATNFAVVQHERDARVAAQERRARIMAARHARAVRIRARDRARAARAARRAASARPAPRPQPQRNVVVRQTPAPVYRAPQPVVRQSPQRKTGTAEKKGGGSLQFDDSG